MAWGIRAKPQIATALKTTYTATAKSFAALCFAHLPLPLSGLTIIYTK